MRTAEPVMKPYRLARVAEAIRETAAETILFELHDPRVKNVTVTRAEVSPDLQHAKIYVSIMGTEAEQRLTLHGLHHAAGFIQSKLAKRLQTRFTPTIHFVLDEGVKNSIAIGRLIDEALGKAPAAAAADEATADEDADEAVDGAADEAPNES